MLHWLHESSNFSLCISSLCWFIDDVLSTVVSFNHLTLLNPKHVHQWTFSFDTPHDGKSWYTFSCLNTQIQVGPWPVEYAETCAKAIMDGAVKGKRYVQVPSWYNIFTLYRVFAPEVLDWMYRLLYVKKTSPNGTPYSKAILDATGAKKALYPPSIQGWNKLVAKDGGIPWSNG